MEETTRFEQAIAAFDSAHREDPNTELVDGEPVPHEWIDADRVSAWVLKLDPAASEVLRLASHCQHIRRWEIPRASYPQNRAGYLKWRQDLKTFHAKVSGEILRDVGYDESTISAVSDLNLKKGLAQGGDVQTLEDALCLTFLEFEFEQFRHSVPPERMVRILRKTWGKMSEVARSRALGLPLSDAALSLVKQALADDSENTAG